MIVGRLSDAAKQQSVLPAPIFRALAEINRLDLGKLDAGRYEIDGDRLYYMVQDVDTRSLDESRPEAHRRYADIQIPVSGAERYGFALPQPALIASEDHLEAKDVAFYPTPANEAFIDIEPGGYIVFLPGELHRPCLAIGDKGKLHKAVVKVRADLLGI